MRTFSSIALSGLIAVMSLTGGMTAASAGGPPWRKGPPPHVVHKWHKPPPPHYVRRPPPPRYRDGSDWAPGFATGAFLGLSFGALAAAPRYYYEAPAYYPPPPYPGLSVTEVHIEWCIDRYRSYDPATNTFIGYDGYAHECVSPYY